MKFAELHNPTVHQSCYVDFKTLYRLKTVNARNNVQNNSKIKYHLMKNNLQQSILPDETKYHWFDQLLTCLRYIFATMGKFWHVKKFADKCFWQTLFGCKVEKIFVLDYEWFFRDEKKVLGDWLLRGCLS